MRENPSFFSTFIILSHTSCIPSMCVIIRIWSNNVFKYSNKFFISFKLSESKEPKPSSIANILHLGKLDILTRAALIAIDDNNRYSVEPVGP